DWERYSSRQKQKMKLGGLVGRWQLLQVPAPLLPFVHLGQWLHVGKEGAFGLGKYQWERSAR
ncbi:CRISPR system precrRNA processing endoribonuclease RAMP protein Cas6, partial [Arthrospira platensis SPKY1]|nr:CRISPR system precrRNA processing endoribonuclease RAMP protein Cas6 [Arthrospira platensis SPKY1]